MPPTTSLNSGDAESPSAAGNPGHRDDIQGLRAIAVGSVVAGHAGVEALGGGFVGVDLFFVLSGFLITQLLLREWFRGGRISLAGFWARRARRLLPASTLVLVATTFATVAFLPATQFAPVSRDIVWSAAFSANWRFAEQGTDYFAQDRLVSPVQHYWSLGVEEQFYVVWPVLVIACGVLAAALVRRRGLRPGPHAARWAVGLLAVVIIVVSFTYSVGLTRSNQPYAYFGTPARAWQLAVGALLAASVPLLRRVGRPVRTLLAVLGVVGFVWAVLTLQETGGGSTYPGTVALVPTLAAALLITAGTGDGGTVIGTALSWRPLVWLGDLSYSLYLWHFPVLVIGTSYLDPAGWGTRLGLVAFSLLAAWVSFRFLETPVRRLPRLARSAGLSLGLGAALVGLAAATALAVPRAAPTATTVNGLDGKKVDLGQVLLDPLDGLRPRKGAQVCTAVAYAVSDVDSCDFGDTDGSRKAVLLGDSHMGSLYRAFVPGAKASGWHLKVWTKPACPVSDVTVFDPLRKAKFTQCDDFRRKIFARTLAEKPDLVVLVSQRQETVRVFDRATGRRLSEEASRAKVVAGWRSTIREFTSRDIPVVVVKDWPRADESPPDCLTRTKDVRDCTFAPWPDANPEELAARGLPGVRLVEIDQGYCTATRCSPVVGDTLVYRDKTHLTLKYAEELAPLVRKEVLDPAR